eukprot:scaffold91995_cov54-Attheya_sp.AAC.1
MTLVHELDSVYPTPKKRSAGFTQRGDHPDEPWYNGVWFFFRKKMDLRVLPFLLATRRSQRSAVVSAEYFFSIHRTIPTLWPSRKQSLHCFLGYSTVSTSTNARITYINTTYGFVY